MLSEKEKIDLITQISLDLNEAKDIDHLLERILTNVRKFYNADAGSIYLRDGDNLKFSYSQNATLSRRLKPGKKLIYNTFSIPINNMSIA
ncbi:MAG: phosphohydrolase, partial [Pseudomonadota bacterium]